MPADYEPIRRISMRIARTGTREPLALLWREARPAARGVPAVRAGPLFFLDRICMHAYEYLCTQVMSKRSRQTVILQLLERGPAASQDDLRKELAKRGFKVTQATLSRDIHDLKLVKTTE